jgi:dTDP-4-dehydrorhamnose reductase
MQKLLITGASGFLGWNLCQVAQSDWEVHGTYNRHPVSIPVSIPDPPELNSHQIDLTDADLLETAIDRIAPDAIIHLAAASSPNFCQAHPVESARINIETSRQLAKISAHLSIPFVFTSTDLVFDGTKAPYTETDPVTPINIYGEQKVTAEREVLAAYPQATICRMPLMFGNVPPAGTSFIQPWLKALADRQNLQLFVDEFRTPVSATTAARGLLLALAKSPGILNLGGNERISRYEFGKLLAEVFELDSSLISPSSQKDLVMAAPRAADVSLDSSKAIELGYAPLSLRQELELVRLQVRSIRS